jgi:predicted phage tail protein
MQEIRALKATIDGLRKDLVAKDQQISRLQQQHESDSKVNLPGQIISDTPQSEPVLQPVPVVRSMNVVLCELSGSSR